MTALKAPKERLYPYLRLIELYENHQWEEINALGHRLGIHRVTVAELVKTATEWPQAIKGHSLGSEQRG